MEFKIPFTDYYISIGAILILIVVTLATILIDWTMILWFSGGLLTNIGYHFIKRKLNL